MERKVFTYKDVEEAQRYIGKVGWFSDSLKQAEEGDGRKGVLFRVSQGASHCFLSEDGKYRFDASQFFSPLTKPVDRWVPFTAEEMAFALAGVPIKVKSWKSDTWSTASAVIGGVALIKMGNNADLPYTAQDLFDNWCFLDGTPCGKKVVE